MCVCFVGDFVCVITIAPCVHYTGIGECMILPALRDQRDQHVLIANTGQSCLSIWQIVTHQYK